MANELKAFNDNPHLNHPKLTAHCSLLTAHCSLKRFLQALNLRGVVVRVRRVNLEPGLDSVKAAFGVPALALPILFGELRENLRRGLARSAKCVERRAEVAVVIVEAGSVAILVIALNHRALFVE